MNFEFDKKDIQAEAEQLLEELQNENDDTILKEHLLRAFLSMDTFQKFFYFLKNRKTIDRIIRMKISSIESAYFYKKRSLLTLQYLFKKLNNNDMLKKISTELQQLEEDTKKLISDLKKLRVIIRKDDILKQFENLNLEEISQLTEQMNKLL